MFKDWVDNDGNVTTQYSVSLSYHVFNIYFTYFLRTFLQSKILYMES